MDRSASPDQFLLQHLSHDLRSPVRLVLSFAEILEAEEAHALSDTGRMCLDSIITAGNRMHEMLEGLLKLARVDTQAKGFTSLDLGAIVDVSARALAMKEDQPLKVIRGELPQVSGDIEQLTWLVGELLSNAHRLCSAEGRTGTVSVAGEVDGDVARITFTDDGPGIPRNAADLVFEVFQKAEGATGDGAGTGLTICRAICLRHGGAIWINPDISPGTQVVVELPLAGKDASDDR